jgi:flagellar protein FliT
MMKYKNTNTTYEAVENLTSQMLLAAKAEDWDKLAALESDCAKYIEQLKFYENVVPLSKDASQRKAASIKRILADDLEIRNLVSPRMAKLSALMNSSQNGKKLNQTYGK